MKGLIISILFSGNSFTRIFGTRLSFAIIKEICSKKTFSNSLDDITFEFVSLIHQAYQQ